jgi:hypothetical protein
MHRPKLTQRKGETHFIGGVKPGEDGVGAFDVPANARRVNRGGRYGHHMPHCAANASVNGFVRFRFNYYTDGFVVFKHFIY